MHKITSTSSRLCGGSVTRLTGRREYVHVGLTAGYLIARDGMNADFAGAKICLAADTCQSSLRSPFQQLSKLFHARSLVISIELSFVEHRMVR